MPERAGPIHPYIPSVAGCWERYCTVLDWASALAGGEATGTVQDLVDAYAAQHAANPDRRNRQSVAVHLMSLCSGLERGLSGQDRRARLATWVGREHPTLEPLPDGFAVTIGDVAAAPAGRRSQAVHRLARATWSAWSGHHDTVRAWLDG